MSNVTTILSKIESGDPAAAEQLLPLVYEELRKLAAARMAREQPGQTLQATALVHEAYLRLVKNDDQVAWDSRGHFFASAAEAMRRILLDNARRKQAQRHGGGRRRVDLDDGDLATRHTPDEMVALDDALSKLGTEDRQAAEIVKLRGIVPPIRFSSGAAEIPQSSIAELRKVLDGMRDLENVRLHLVGHADTQPLSAALARIYGDNEGLSYVGHLALGEGGAGDLGDGPSFRGLVFEGEAPIFALPTD